MFIGNLFVYLQFQGKDTIGKDTRTVVIWTLTGLAIAGIAVMLVFPKAKEQAEEVAEGPTGPIAALKGAAKLFLTKDMLLLSTTFVYTGKRLWELEDFMKTDKNRRKQ